MFRSLTLLIIALALLERCNNNTKPNKAISIDTIRSTHVITQKETGIFLTDSEKLVKHLDSLPKAAFPYYVSELNNQAPNINLAEFKNKSLFNITFKRIPRVIGGAGIDMYGIVDSTFDLCDTSYKANWVLVNKTPKFFVVEIGRGTMLVTIDYHLKVVEAIEIIAGDPTGNDNFQAELNSTIYKNLKVILHYTYYLRTDAERHFDTTNEDDIWRIDKNGKFQPIRYSPNGRSL